MRPRRLHGAVFFILALLLAGAYLSVRSGRRRADPTDEPPLTDAAPPTGWKTVDFGAFSLQIPVNWNADAAGVTMGDKFRTWEVGSAGDFGNAGLRPGSVMISQTLASDGSDTLPALYELTRKNYKGAVTEPLEFGVGQGRCIAYSAYDAPTENCGAAECVKTLAFADCLGRDGSPFLLNTVVTPGQRKYYADAETRRYASVFNHIVRSVRFK